jgi:hypothetical protein
MAEDEKRAEEAPRPRAAAPAKEAGAAGAVAIQVTGEELRKALQPHDFAMEQAMIEEDLRANPRDVAPAGGVFRLSEDDEQLYDFNGEPVKVRKSKGQIVQVETPDGTVRKATKGGVEVEVEEEE